MIVSLLTTWLSWYLWHRDISSSLLHWLHILSSSLMDGLPGQQKPGTQALVGSGASLIVTLYQL